MATIEGYDGGDFIDCTECGHAVEQHSANGCEAGADERCTCGVRWTVKAIKALRREVGLPAEWRRQYL